MNEKIQHQKTGSHFTFVLVAYIKHFMAIWQYPLPCSSPSHSQVCEVLPHSCCTLTGLISQRRSAYLARCFQRPAGKCWASCSHVSKGTETMLQLEQTPDGGAGGVVINLGEV